MITAKTYRVIDVALRQSTKMYTIPFVWNSAQFKLTSAPLTPKRLFWPLTIWAYSSFILVSKFVHGKELANDQVKNVLHMLFFILYSCVAVLAVNFLWNRQHLASLFNQYFRFIQKLDGKSEIVLIASELTFG